VSVPDSAAAKLSAESAAAVALTVRAAGAGPAPEFRVMPAPFAKRTAGRYATTHADARRRVLIRLIALLLVGACRQAEREPTLTNGRHVSSLAAENLTAVLVYDPATCLACDEITRDWLELQRQRPGSVQIVLSRPPTAFERRRLTAQRVRLAGTLQDRPPSSGQHYLREMVFVGGLLFTEATMNRLDARRAVQQVFTARGASGAGQRRLSSQEP